MRFEPLAAAMKANADPRKAVSAAAYMRNQFPFLGVPAPVRRKVCEPFFKEESKEAKIDWAFIDACWREECREFQYIAVEYLRRKKKNLTKFDVPRLKKLVVTKSWWDTVDGLDRLFGEIASRYPKVVETLLAWSVDSNIWLRRVAIDHQLGLGEQTDADLLEKIVVNNFGQTEFFVNKAIGWSLRQYSKTNPERVRAFIERNRDRFSATSLREAKKYLEK